MVSSPVFATCATFTIYVLINSGENIRTTIDAFSVPLLLLALCFPNNYAGRMNGNVVPATSGARRIVAFLDLPMLQEGNFNNKDDDDHDDDYSMTKVPWTGRHLYLVSNENVKSCPVNTKYLCVLATLVLRILAHTPSRSRSMPPD